MSFSRVFFCRAWLLMLALYASLSQAGASLTADQASNYVALLPQVRAFSEQLDGELGTELRIELQPRDGEVFAPHSKGLALLQQRQPQDYLVLTALVEAGGFGSAGDWARAGDRVMLGYAALKAEQAGPELLQMAAGMDGVDPQMLALMPPQLQARMKQVRLLARALAAVEPADKAVVRPLLPQLDGYWQQDWRRYQGQ